MRWSSEPQSWGDSERRQEQLARDWCQREGRVLADETYADRGVSGWHGANRQAGALGALLRVVRAGDTILIEDTDRWSREKPLDSLNALRDTVRRGVEIVFLKTGVRVTERNFDDPAILFTNFFSSYLANAENEKRSHRIRQAMEAKRQQIRAGKATFGRLPAWLSWDAPPRNPARKPVVVEAKAELVRRIFSLCLEGKGVHTIERLMRGCPPIANSKRADWNSRFIHRLLKDKAVIGWYVPTGTPGIFPPIVSEESFYAASVKLESRRNWTVRESCENNSLFTNLAFCARCGHSLVRQSTKSHGRKYNYLICSGYLRRMADSKCDCAGIPYGYFESSFLSLLLLQDGLVRKAMSGEQASSPLDSLKGELADVQAQAAKYLQLIGDDPNPSRRLYDALKQAEAKEAELKDQIEGETAKAIGTKPPMMAYGQFQVEFATHAHDPEYRGRIRLALREIVNKIVVSLGEDKYQVFFAGGVAPVTVRRGKTPDTICELDPPRWLRSAKHAVG
jgi:DNA invertase Pin-like site-specific DNA recombinase